MRYLTLLVVLVAAACAPASPEGPAGATVTDSPVVVGVGADAESRLLGHVMRELLEAASIPVAVERLDDRSAIRQALELGAVDVAVGYTGEAWLEELGRPDPPGDPRASWEAVSEADAERGLVWMRPRFAEPADPTRPPANATFALFVQSAPLARAPDLTTMTEFASRVSAESDARVCVDDEFGVRRDGLSATWRAYSVDPDRSYLATTPQEAVRGVAAGGCLAGLASATSGEAWRLSLWPLIDDRRVFPAFVVTPVVAEDATREHPGLLDALRPLPQVLTTRMLGQWNARVVAGAEITEVAAGAAEIVLAATGDGGSPGRAQAG